jgi:hypothetical protein
MLVGQKEVPELLGSRVLGAWVTFAWNRENEYLIAKIIGNGEEYLTMHRVGDEYSFVINRGLQLIIDFLNKYPATIAFTGAGGAGGIGGACGAGGTNDGPVILASRRLNAGAALMLQSIDNMADGKNVAKIIPNYLKPELSRYLGKLYTLGEFANNNKIIADVNPIKKAATRVFNAKKK